ncbi:hypothetical protein D3C71_1431980 [compost metagenome]
MARFRLASARSARLFCTASYSAMAAFQASWALPKPLRATLSRSRATAMRTARTGSLSNGVSNGARSAGGRKALIARTALSRTCGAGLPRSLVASFNACSLGYAGSSASSVAR